MSIKTTKGTMTSGKVRHKGMTYPIKEAYIKKDGKLQLFFSGKDDTTGSPGKADLVAGTINAGFFGELKEHEVIDFNTLQATTGLAGVGSTYLSEQKWLKCASGGKIVFFMSKPFKSKISYKTLKAKGLIEGKSVEHNGIKYKVRTISSEEWDNIILKLHSGWGIDYPLSFFGLQSGPGIPNILTQITSSQDYDWSYITRGNIDDISYKGYAEFTESNGGLQWGAVLEVIKI